MTCLKVKHFLFFLFIYSYAHTLFEAFLPPVPGPLLLPPTSLAVLLFSPILLKSRHNKTHVQRLSPMNKGVSPYIPLQAGYISKQQGLIHICYI
jgi:hypothetical protein